MTDKPLIKNCFTCTHHDHRSNYCALGKTSMREHQVRGIWTCVRWQQDAENVVYELDLKVRKES